MIINYISTSPNLINNYAVGDSYYIVGVNPTQFK